MYPSLVNQTPPAPYASAYPMPSQNLMTGPYDQPQGYAKGGHVGGRPDGFVEVHVSKGEIPVLDHIQGKVEQCPHSGMRKYSHLEELLKNPHILRAVAHHTKGKRKAHCHGGMAMRGYAQGGMVDGHHDYGNARLNQMASNGIHGDTELALIGPHTRQVFNELAEGGTVTNPHDGRPQYWSLGDTLSGIGNAIGTGVNTVGNFLGNGAANVAHGIESGVNTIGSGIGSVGNAVGNGLSTIGNNISNGNYVNMIGNAAQQYGPQAWDMIKSGAEKAAPYVGKLGNMALDKFGNEINTGLTARFGPMGGLAGEVGQMAGHELFNWMEGDKFKNSPDQKAAANAAGNAALSGIDAYRGGANPMQVIGQGMQGAGAALQQQPLSGNMSLGGRYQTGINGPLSGALMAGGSNLYQGNSPFQAAKNAGQAAAGQTLSSLRRVRNGEVEPHAVMGIPLAYQ